MFIVGAAAAAVLVGVAATTVAVLQPWGSDSAPTEGLLAGSFPTQPAPVWTLAPSDVLPTANAEFFSPRFDRVQYRNRGAVVTGESVIVAVSDPQQSAVTLAAVDTEEGTVRWTTAFDDFRGCANADIDGALACLSRGSETGESAVNFVDLDTGAVESTYTAPFFVNAVYADGADFYVAGRDVDAEASAISKGTVTSPASAWSQIYPDDRCADVGSGDTNEFGVRGSVIAMGAGGSVVARSSDGSRILDNVGSVTDLGDRGVVAVQCPENLSTGTFTSTVLSADGDVAFSASARIVDYDVRANEDESAPLITDAGDALDPLTGKVLWSGGVTEASASLVGDLVVFGGESVDAVDLSTGKTVWTAPNPFDGAVAATDGTTLLSATENSFTAMSLADGSVSWRTTLTGDADGRAEVVPSDGGVLHASGRALTRFGWTGPPSALPRIETVPAGSAGGSDSYVTRCGTPPVFTPTEFTTDAGALVVTMEVTATCPGGDVLSSDATTISISQGSTNVASAVFDFSGAPLALTGAGSGSSAGSSGTVVQSFRFPAGSFWRLPDTLEPAATGGTAGTSYVVDCVPGGSPAVQEMSTAESVYEPLTASGPAAPAVGDAESAAFDALRFIADTDRPVIERELGERWVPQLSSKRPGLVADGMSWDNSSTLSEHLDLRLRYPNVKLMWSGEWSVFSFDNFWVTGAGVTFANASGANNWCATNGLDSEHCFAKLISATHPVAGSTGLR